MTMCLSTQQRKLGLDYLPYMNRAEQFFRQHNFAIVDESTVFLIDEATDAILLSLAPSQRTLEIYTKCHYVIRLDEATRF